MSSSSTSPQSKYDVFVSFRGTDVRDAFVSYLTDRLKDVGLSCFCDDESELTGNMIAENIFPAIRQARFALIVLSKNYGTSEWCLNELVEILRCRERKNLVVIPIFYYVDPADVENLTSQSEFHTKGKKDQQIEIWKGALREVKKLLGFERKKFRKEPDLINEIVQSIRGRICPSQSLETAIGAERLVNDVIHLLNIGEGDVRVIGISGIIGIGKTMVARAVCEGTLGDFQRSIFLDKVGEANSFDFVRLQKKLLQNLLGINEQMPEDSFHGYIERIRNRLRHKKILLVLDGVTKKEQINNLGVERPASFCQGSRILITTRDPDLLKDPYVDDTYNVEGLNRDEAFRLFCHHAFKREEPRERYEVLSRYLAHYAGGYPAALEKWGSFLNGRSTDEWQKFSDKLMKDPEHINSIIQNFWQEFPEYPCKVGGPLGGDLETETWKDEGYQGVMKIDGGVDSEGIKFITVQYHKNGHPPEAVTHGAEGGKKDIINLSYPGEYLSYMSSHTKEDSGRTILQSLTFHTNRGKRASIGTDKEGRQFSLPYTGHKIVGFHGSCNGFHLESIEAIYKRVPHTPIGYSGEVFGPFGGAGEKSWDSGDIKGIFVTYADFIMKIKFDVDDDTSSRPQTIYGENGGKSSFKVKLETPYEWITSFSGYFQNECNGRILINSLTFQTNKRILGPIGREEGKHFSSPSPSEAVEVVRFFGRSVDYLESIGAQVKSNYPFKSVGLFGCSNASNWDDGDDHINVRKINVQFAQDDKKSVGTIQTSTEKTFIQSITFWYEVKNEIFGQEERRHGILAEDVEPCTIEIDADDYLTSMSGYYTEHGITSLTFRTTKKVVELIGPEEKIGIHFSSPVTGGKIVGFYGTSEKNLKAIGAYFERIPHLYPIKSIGPFGFSSEYTWKYVNIAGVREIEVKHDIHIHSIKLVDKESRDPSYLVFGPAKGGTLPSTQVKLDYPQKYLTSISGYVQNGAIQSLTFHSNKGSYGPFGKKDEKDKDFHFWYPSNGSRITGFYGTQDPDNGTLKSIGVYVEPIPRMYPFKTIGPFGGFGGTPWDDGVYTDVRGFRISFSEAIEAIGIAYDNNGSFVSGPEHGSGHDNNGSFIFGLEPGKTEIEKYMEVILDYPEERLCLIWVWVDEDGNPDQIHDLRIVTTDAKQTYGPLFSTTLSKENKLTRHRIPSEEDGGRIIGFSGTAGKKLNSIKARLEPVLD